MVTVQAERIETFLDDIVHADTQRHATGFDLTAAEIYTVDAPGRIDFGGSELEPARADPVATTKRDPDDDHAGGRSTPARTCSSTTSSSRSTPTNACSCNHAMPSWRRPSRTRRSSSPSSPRSR